MTPTEEARVIQGWQAPQRASHGSEFLVEEYWSEHDPEDPGLGLQSTLVGFKEKGKQV
jgi:hypothetical protein